MIIIVIDFLSFKILLIIFSVVSISRALVASSKIKINGFLIKALAIPILCD